MNQILFKAFWLTSIIFSAIGAYADFPTPLNTPNGQFISKCLGCHGRNGVSGYSDFPNLAGLDQSYILKQLNAFQKGERTDYTMNAMPYMVANLTEDELFGLSDIFSRFPVENVMKTEMSANELKFFEKGKALINGNTLTCRFCHLGNATQDGPSTPDFPMLTGQQKNYLIHQIKAFKDKKRWSPIMNSDIVGQLTDDEIESIATYFRYMKAR